MGRRKPRAAATPGVKLPFQFWVESKDWTPGEQAVAAFLLTCQQRKDGREGLLRMNVDDVHAGLSRGWKAEQVVNAVIRLEHRRWLEVDGDWMLLTQALRYESPWGEKQVPGAVRRLELAPRDSRLWPMFLDAAEQHAPDLFAALVPSGVWAIEKAAADTVSTARNTVCDSVSDTPSGDRRGYRIEPSAHRRTPRFRGTSRTGRRAGNRHAAEHARARRHGRP